MFPGSHCQISRVPLFPKNPWGTLISRISHVFYIRFTCHFICTAFVMGRRVGQLTYWVLDIFGCNYCFRQKSTKAACWWRKRERVRIRGETEDVGINSCKTTWQRQDRMSIRPRCSGQTRSILTAHVQLVIQMVDRPNTTLIGQHKKTLTLKALL